MKQKTCEWCGKVFQPDHWSRRYCCSEHAHLANLRRMKQWCDEHKDKDRRELAITVVEDPLPAEEGGFPVGAELSVVSFKEMLFLGTCTEGMRVKYRGKDQVVRGRVGSRQVAVSLQ